MEKFIYIKNRINQHNKDGEVVLRQRADEVLTEYGDFVIEYTDYEQLKTMLVTQVAKIFLNHENHELHQDRCACVRMQRAIGTIDSKERIEHFISHFINCSGIIMKAKSKVIFEDYEYYYVPQKIVKVKFDPQILERHSSDDEVLIWERQVRPLPGTVQYVKSNKVFTRGDFVDQYGPALYQKPKK